MIRASLRGVRDSKLGFLACVDWEDSIPLTCLTRSEHWNIMHNTIGMRRLADDSRREAEKMGDTARLTLAESSQMRNIAIVTAAFLPPGLVAVMSHAHSHLPRKHC